MFKQKSSLWCSAAALTIAILVMFLAGCESSNPSSDDDDIVTGTTVTVTATPVSISVGQFSVVEATVEAGGSGVADQEIVFSVLPAGAGTCAPVVDTTDADGVAATMFTGSVSGSASVTAAISGSSTNGSAWLTVVESGQTGFGEVNMTVSPSLLFADGEDTARVTIVVSDANGDPAADNTLIRICAGEKFVDKDGNGYWSEGIDSLVYDNNANGTWDAVGNIPSTAYTGAGTGTASVDFVSGTKAGTFYIKATVDEGGITGSDEQSVQLNPAAELHSIYLAAERMNIVVSQTGGIETSELHATGYDINGNLIPEGIAITFTILDGPDGGEFLGDDPLATEAVAFTNSQGIATVPIHSGFVSGTIRVRAYANTVLSNATQIMVSAGPPKYIVVGVDTFNVQWWYTVNERMGVVAVVSDTFLNPVVDSTVVYFSCDEGSMVSHEARTRDLEGVAHSEWISGNNVETADGKVWIYAETAGGTVFDSCMFYNTSAIFTAWAEPNVFSLLANASDWRWVSIFALDVNGNPVVDGTKIEFEGDDIIHIEAATLADGWNGSSDVIQVASAGALDYDYSMNGTDDDGVGLVVAVGTPLYGSLFSMFTVTLETGYAYSDNCKVTGPVTVAPSATVSFGAVIQDRWGNPLGDHSLSMEASAGTVTAPGTATTNGYGEANGLEWMAPGAATTVTITITDNDARGQVVLTETVTVQ
ncbi:MAG: hypothetical protein JSV52_02175 [Candidatus Zixiibacteriota bacterium]|nr:MAG: hypothetical protein JSV52_02175 [candidate division Zixibacteria bacterium]